LLKVLTAFRRCDSNARLREGSRLEGRLAETLNEIIDLCDRNAKEFEWVGRIAGREGKVNVRANLGPVSGPWNAARDAVKLIGDLVQPSTQMIRVSAGVSKATSRRAWHSTPTDVR
jgi:hypothetical protein